MTTTPLSAEVRIVGCQEFPWSQIYREKGQSLSDHLPQVLEAVHRSGAEAYEPFLPHSREQSLRLSALLSEYSLQMPSAYANVRLHEDDWRERVASTLEAARWAGEAGMRVLVINPEPINWSQPLDKNDAQLEVQARAMQALGEGLRAQGQALAYHIHAPEMRQAAREFHHTLLNTDPEAVALCLDAHWIYRGAGDSQAALYDIVKLYGARIASLHLRQSRGGVWSEVLEDGDINYEPLARRLREMSFDGPIILEQAREEGTPRTMEPEAALRHGIEWTRRLFSAPE